ncbi:hypothetical protein E4U60_007001 [Claviceps pazoutovae]|uniref:Uncharacterized protein n=1 Tax=Claviceps pazoutovae TaxID=1649127 RepID=A0A9P7MF68_9HYPO|nr:hypothetical protein E4U60_007001 [Claviceps pazoutovae]
MLASLLEADQLHHERATRPKAACPRQIVAQAMEGTGKGKEKEKEKDKEKEQDKGQRTRRRILAVRMKGKRKTVTQMGFHSR